MFYFTYNNLEFSHITASVQIVMCLHKLRYVGGMGGEAERLVKKLASKMEYHTGQRYSDAVGYIRKRLHLEILKTTVISLRGDRGARQSA